MTATTADLKRLRVKRELQGKGIGEHARLLILRAHELGFARLTADTTRQVPAQQLLQKLGFIEIRRQQFSRFELIYYKRTFD